VKKFPRLKKWLLRVLLFLIVAVSGYWWLANYLGARALEEATALARDKGISLERSDFAVPELPDDEDLLKNPVFLGEYQHEGPDKLTGWDQLTDYELGYPPIESGPSSGKLFPLERLFEGELSDEESIEKLSGLAIAFERRLDALSQVLMDLPEQEFMVNRLVNIPTKEGPLLDFWDVSQSNIDGILSCYRWSASLALRSSNVPVALDRIRTLDRLRRNLSGPSSNESFYSFALLSVIGGLIWEGIYLRAWNEEHLDELGWILKSYDHKNHIMITLKYHLALDLEYQRKIADLRAAASDSEFAEDLEFSDKWRVWKERYGPQGWRDRTMATTILGMISVLETVEMEDYLNLEKRLPEGLESEPLSAETIFGASQWVGYFIPRMETMRRVALIAIESERVYLRDGKYPDRLIGMGVPTKDMMSREERDLHYSLGQGGRPVISSVDRDSVGNDRIKWQFHEDPGD
jgi:hypothetical protein